MIQSGKVNGISLLLYNAKDSNIPHIQPFMHRGSGTGNIPMI
jgi:hypothetical protein